MAGLLSRRRVAASFAALSALLAAASAAAEPIEMPALEFVREFFRATDAYDFEVLGRTFAPGAKIVVGTGAELDAAEYLSRRRADTRTPPPVRELSDFETISRGPIVVVALTNRTIRPDGPSAADRSLRETWILERSGKSFTVLRAHYSVISASPPR